MDVIGLGALNLDLIYRVDFAHLGIERGRERRGREGEEKLLLQILRREGELKAKSGGGSAANTIYALARMGFSCGYVGKAGRDKRGDFLLEELGRAGVDIKKVKRGKESGLCLILLDEVGERTVFVFPNANDTLSFSEVDVDYLNKAQFLHMSSFIGGIPFKAEKEVVKRVKTRISFDPGEPHASRGLEELAPILERTFIFFPTEKEVELLTNKDYKEGLRELLNYGIEIIACKLGEKGSYVLSKREEIEMPSEKVKVVDTIGAGDVYAAGFLAGLLRGLNLKACAKLATKLAAKSITGYGRENYPDKQDFLSFK